MEQHRFGVQPKETASQWTLPTSLLNGSKSAHWKSKATVLLSMLLTSQRIENSIILSSLGPRRPPRCPRVLLYFLWWYQCRAWSRQSSLIAGDSFAVGDTTFQQPTNQPHWCPVPWGLQVGPLCAQGHPVPRAAVPAPPATSSPRIPERAENTTRQIQENDRELRSEKTRTKIFAEKTELQQTINRKKTPKYYKLNTINTLNITNYKTPSSTV